MIIENMLRCFVTASLIIGVASPAPGQRRLGRDLRSKEIHETTRRYTDFMKEAAETRALNRLRYHYFPPHASSKEYPSDVAGHWARNFDWLAWNQFSDHGTIPQVGAMRLSRGSVPPDTRARIFFPAIFGVESWKLPDRLGSARMSVPPQSAKTLRELQSDSTGDLRTKIERSKRRSSIMREWGIQFTPPPLGRRMTIVSALPHDTRQFAAVFESHTPSAVDLRAYRAADARLRTLGDHVGGDLAAAFSTTHRIVLIVGHNDAGLIRFPDGRREKLSELSERCRRALKICVFLVCNGRAYVRPEDVAYGRAVTPTEAARIAADIARTMELQDPDPADPQAALRSLAAVLYVASDRHGTQYLYRRVGEIFMVTLILFTACDGDECPGQS